MPLNILIVPDKFKGTLTAAEAARAIAIGWSKARPGDDLELLPASDGGDGFGEVMGDLLDAKVQLSKTVDASHLKHTARWWWRCKDKTAIIESAQVIGLGMLPIGKFHPFTLDSFGLGEVIRAASAKGARLCIIGLGGSATNDGGFGLARALGWEFLDRKGKLIERWTGLRQLTVIRAPRRRHWFDKLIVAVDVKNQLLGVRGATRVYGPQKGLRPFELQAADHCLRRLADIFRKDFGRDYRRTFGSGAAGGLGFGLLAFLDAEAESGFEIFAREANLQDRLSRKHLVITGEGALDQSSLTGKGVGEIARFCLRLRIPCLAFAGILLKRKKYQRLFKQVYALADLTTLADAKSKPAHWLEVLSQKAAAGLQIAKTK